MSYPSGVSSACKIRFRETSGSKTMYEVIGSEVNQNGHDYETSVIRIGANYKTRTDCETSDHYKCAGINQNATDCNQKSDLRENNCETSERSDSDTSCATNDICDRTSDTSDSTSFTSSDLRENNCETSELSDSDSSCASNDVSDSTSASASTSYTSSGTYVSEGRVQCCYAGPLSQSSNSDSIGESVSHLTGQLRGITLDDKEVKTILNESRLSNGHSTGAIYPNSSRLQLVSPYPHLIESLSSIAQERGGNVFISGSLLRDLGQEDEHIPSHLVCDVCIISPTEPFVFITISSGETSSLKRYSATVAKILRHTVCESANITFDFVNGVIPLSSLNVGELEERIHELESATSKIAFPHSLSMNNMKYRHVLAAILPTEVISSQGPSECETAVNERHMHTLGPVSGNLLTAKLRQKEDINKKLKEDNAKKTQEIDRLRCRVDELLSEVQLLETNLFRERNISRFLADTENYDEECSGRMSISRDHQSSEYSTSRIGETGNKTKLLQKIKLDLLALNCCLEQDPDSLDSLYVDKNIDILRAKVRSFLESRKDNTSDYIIFIIIYQSCNQPNEMTRTGSGDFKFSVYVNSQVNLHLTYLVKPKAGKEIALKSIVLVDYTCFTDSIVEILFQHQQKGGKQHIYVNNGPSFSIEPRGEAGKTNKSEPRSARKSANKEDNTQKTKGSDEPSDDSNSYEISEHFTRQFSDTLAIDLKRHTTHDRNWI